MALFDGRIQPVFVEPSNFRLQGFGSGLKRPQFGAADGREVGRPLAFLVGLDMRAPFDADRAELPQLDRFVVDAAGVSVGQDQ